MTDKTNTLTITIAGKAGTGKTHLAAYITRILHDEGFDVSVSDVDLNGGNWHSMGTKEPIHAVKQKSHIDISTVQMLRTATSS